MMEQPVLEVERVPIAALRPYEGNAKLHTREQIDAVEASIKEFGFGNPVIAWHDEAGDPVIVCGHARVTAAKKLGMGEVPVIFRDDLTDAQRRAYVLADNQTTMMTGWDPDQLAYELDTLAESFDMGDFGFDVGGSFDAIDDLMTEEFSKNVMENTGDTFYISLVFPSSEREAVEAYVRHVGKEEISNRIMREAGEWA